MMGTRSLLHSVDPVEPHFDWVGDINETQNTNVTFPPIADPDHAIADLYDMIPPNADHTNTVGALFIVGPGKKVKLSLTYP